MKILIGDAIHKVTGDPAVIYEITEMEGRIDLAFTTTLSDALTLVEPIRKAIVRCQARTMERPQ